MSHYDHDNDHYDQTGHYINVGLAALFPIYRALLGLYALLAIFGAPLFTFATWGNGGLLATCGVVVFLSGLSAGVTWIKATIGAAAANRLGLLHDEEQG